MIHCILNLSRLNKIEEIRVQLTNATPMFACRVEHCEYTK